MPVNVRKMTEVDKAAIMAILTATPEFTVLDIGVAEEVIDAYLDDPTGPDYKIMVAEADTSIFGYICYGPTPLTVGTWDVYWMAVSRQQQGLGVGRRLLTSAEGEIREAGGRLIFIETSSTREYEKARHFYYSRGYGRVCQIADFYSRGDDKVIFGKRLR